jgi:hypothetical protein
VADYPSNATVLFTELLYVEGEVAGAWNGGKAPAGIKKEAGGII